MNEKYSRTGAVLIRFNDDSW